MCISDRPAAAGRRPARGAPILSPFLAPTPFQTCRFLKVLVGIVPEMDLTMCTSEPDLGRPAAGRRPADFFSSPPPGNYFFSGGARRGGMQAPRPPRGRGQSVVNNYEWIIFRC